MKNDWPMHDFFRYRALGRVEEKWAKMTKDQLIHFIDLCAFRSLYSRNPWARKYWHGVAQDLGEKYF